MIAHSLICGTDTINGFSTGGITNSRTGTGLIRWFSCGEHPVLPMLDYPEELHFDLLKPCKEISLSSRISSISGLLYVFLCKFIFILFCVFII